MIVTPPRSRRLSRAIERIVSSFPNTVTRAMRRLVASAAATTVRGSLPSGSTMCCGLDAARWRIRSRMSMGTQITRISTDLYNPRMSQSNLRSRMTNLLLVIPNLLLLSARLMADPRVPAKERLLVAGAIVYAFMPLDLIPDMIPFVGQVDDAYLIALTLLRLMSVSDPKVVREHWRGGGDVVELIGATALLAGRLLPRKIRRVLTSRVESPRVSNKETMSVPLLIERPAAESKTV